MRALISSLQVSVGASKGHLHPAIELALELKRRGHEAAILPLPSPLSDEDKLQLQRCDIDIIEPPELPPNLPLPPQELARLAKHPETVALAYHSFLVAPLLQQFERVVDIIESYQPDIIIYDLLVYAAPLAARLLNIPDIGYCAGLKLIAPAHLTSSYQSTADQLKPEIDAFLNAFSFAAEFHQLELLSTTHQFVFTPPQFIDTKSMPRGTILTGSLPISTPRCESDNLPSLSSKKTLVLCFGSVLDPANYPQLTDIIINTAKLFEMQIIICTKSPQLFTDDIITEAYLPLPQLLQHADIFIHHGGANTFSEAMTLGTPQLLIPLTTDQPIQAEYLNQSEAGIAIAPHDLTLENCFAAFQRLLNVDDDMHQRIKVMKNLFQQSNGAQHACDIIETRLSSTRRLI